MYDALESDLHDNGKNGTRFAENDYFKKAVCLNSRGKIQARAMGEHIKNIGLPIGHVASSVSCRARQTAELAFGKYDTLYRILVHDGPYNEEKPKRLKNLKNFYLNLTFSKNKNTIVSSHNSVVTCEMFENCKDKKLELEEGGFYIISIKENKLYLEHEFHNYNEFNKIFYKR
ncbi:histidine phosphatase family protein [Pelagibacteraceae bacterium]|nr:histidine phosphatase family protein [Pelagibacteraceae bacterium]